MNSFLQRMIVIIIGCTISITCVLYSKVTLILLYIVFGMGCFTEYHLIMQRSDINKIAGSLLSFMSYFYYIIYKMDLMTNNDIIRASLIFIAMLVALSTDQLDLFLKTILGIVWIFPAMMTSIEFGLEDPYKLIVIMTIAWMTDGFAYMFGKRFGRIKLAESISPNKTIEGTVVGILAAVIAAYISSFYYTKISRIDLCVLALLCGVTGQIGDLIESKFKRKLGIKDTSNILGDHGGCLDRFDSILLAIPVSFVYLLIF